MIRIRLIDETLILPLKVTPKGGKDILLAYSDGDEAIRLKVAAPPEEGKANQAVIELLAKTLGLAKSRLTLTSGAQSRHKQVTLALQKDEAITLLNLLASAMQSESVKCFERA